MKLKTFQLDKVCLVISWKLWRTKKKIPVKYSCSYVYVIHILPAQRNSFFKFLLKAFYQIIWNEIVFRKYFFKIYRKMSKPREGRQLTFRSKRNDHFTFFAGIMWWKTKCLSRRLISGKSVMSVMSFSGYKHKPYLLFVLLY